MTNKNNPNERNKMVEVNRVCVDCGKSGVIDKAIQRILRQVGGKKTFIWRCKSGCQK